MKALWEKRNLGVSAFEVEIENGDTVKQLSELYNISEAEYLVVKVPPGKIDLMFDLSESGFKFIEAVQKTSVTEIPALNSIQRKLENVVSHRLASPKDCELIFDNIKKGIFKTDRIALDPKFSVELAAQRYVGWITDVQELGGAVHCIEYRGEIAGFFVIVPRSPRVYESVLAGVFPDKSPIGLGSMINHLAYKFCFENGAKEVITSYSLNNPGATAIHLGLPLKIINQFYVYVKHVSHYEGNKYD